MPPEIARELAKGDKKVVTQVFNDFMRNWADLIQQKLRTGEDAFETDKIYIHLGNL